MKRFLPLAYFIMIQIVAAGQLVNNGGQIVVKGSSTFLASNLGYLSENDGVLKIDDGTVVLKGNFTNNSGGIAGTDGNLKFEGTSAQQITGTVSTAFPINVSINNASGVSLSPTSNIPVNITNLTIEPSGKLIITPGKALTVSGTLTNNGVASGLILQSNVLEMSSLIHSTSGVQGTAQFVVPGLADQWHMFSSPVNNQEIIPPLIEHGHLFSWSEGAQSWVKFGVTVGYPTWLETNSGLNTMIPGRGYLIQYDNLVIPQKEFIGAFNQGPVSFSLALDSKTKDPYHGFQIVGNPYPSAIDWSASSWARTNLELSGIGYAYWTWNASVGNYGTFISGGEDGSGTNGATRYLAANQAFWVKAIASGPLTMNNSVRVHSTGEILKASTIDNNLLISVFGNANTYSDQTIISIDNADNPGGAIKMFSLYSSAPSLYTVKNEIKYSINLLTNEPNQPITMAFKAGVAGNYTINASGGLLSKNVVLEDLMTGIRTVLNMNNSYSFRAVQTDNPNRFLLHFGATSAVEKISLKGPLATYNNGTLSILNPYNGDSKADLYDVSGRLVSTYQLEDDGYKDFNIELHAIGVYLIRIRNNKETMIGKFLVHN